MPTVKLISSVEESSSKKVTKMKIVDVLNASAGGFFIEKNCHQRSEKPILEVLQIIFLFF